jgi:hypothetical protein
MKPLPIHKQQVVDFWCINDTIDFLYSHETKNVHLVYVSGETVTIHVGQYLQRDEHVVSMECNDDDLMLVTDKKLVLHTRHTSLEWPSEICVSRIQLPLNVLGVKLVPIQFSKTRGHTEGPLICCFDEIRLWLNENGVITKIINRGPPKTFVVAFTPNKMCIMYDDSEYFVVNNNLWPAQHDSFNVPGTMKMYIAGALNIYPCANSVLVSYNHLQELSIDVSSAYNVHIRDEKIALCERDRFRVYSAKYEMARVSRWMVADSKKSDWDEMKGEFPKFYLLIDQCETPTKPTKRVFSALTKSQLVDVDFIFTD